MFREMTAGSGSRSASYPTEVRRYDYTNTPEARDSLCWTNWPMFTLGMVVRGHSDDDIHKILGENTLRVLKASVGA